MWEFRYDCPALLHVAQCLLLLADEKEYGVGSVCPQLHEAQRHSPKRNMASYCWAVQIVPDMPKFLAIYQDRPGEFRGMQFPYSKYHAKHLTRKGMPSRSSLAHSLHLLAQPDPQTLSTVPILSILASYAIQVNAHVCVALSKMMLLWMPSSLAMNGWRSVDLVHVKM